MAIPTASAETASSRPMASHQPTCQASARLVMRLMIWYDPPATGYAETSSAIDMPDQHLQAPPMMNGTMNSGPMVDSPKP